MKKEDIPAVIDYMLTDVPAELKKKGYRLSTMLGRIYFEFRLEGGHKISFSIEPMEPGSKD